MPEFRSLVNVAICLVVFALSLSAAILGAGHHDLFADPAPLQAAAPLRAVSEH